MPRKVREVAAVASVPFSSLTLSARKLVAPLKPSVPGLVVPLAVISSCTSRSYDLLAAKLSRRYLAIPSRLTNELRAVPPERPIRMLLHRVLQWEANSSV